MKSTTPTDLFPQTSPPSFSEFWEAYPRKVGKGKAQEAYIQAIYHVTPELLLKAVQVQSKSQEWQDLKFVPHAATWLHQLRWNDTLTPMPDSRTAPLSPIEKQIHSKEYERLLERLRILDLERDRWGKFSDLKSAAEWSLLKARGKELRQLLNIVI